MKPMEHTYKAPNNLQARLTKKRPYISFGYRGRIYARQLWQMAVHCFSSVRLVRYPSATWWRSPLVGYAVALLSQILCLLLFTYVFHNVTFPDAVLLLIVLVISLVWGIGPGILATLISISLLNFLDNAAEGFSLPRIVEWAMFLLTGLAMCLIVCHIEFARAKAESSRQRFYRLFTQGPANVMMLRGEIHISEC